MPEQPCVGGTAWCMPEGAYALDHRYTHTLSTLQGTYYVWGSTWQDSAEQTFPYCHLDVILVETWLKGDGAEGPFSWVLGEKL